VLRESFSVEYKFEKKGSGDFLMQAHPLHLQFFFLISEEVFLCIGINNMQPALNCEMILTYILSPMLCFVLFFSSPK
jgi:hypothetical protein